MHRGWRNTFWQHRKIKIFSEEVRVTCEKKKNIPLEPKPFGLGLLTEEHNYNYNKQ